MQSDETYVCENGHEQQQPEQKWSIQGDPCQICGKETILKDYSPPELLEGISHRS